LKANWPTARLQRDDAAAAGIIERIFQPAGDGNPRAPLRAFVKGTAFQVRVWRALMQVPPGRLISYGQLAAAVGNPNAARAVGSAVGQNCIAYLVPCHRVIRDTGVVGEYRWGRTRKRALLAWESARVVAV
jgi:AraC family transcriptional regulator of adaptative response/methylated-DNA-[protein]-cysteine methyltransferase